MIDISTSELWFLIKEYAAICKGTPDHPLAGEYERRRLAETTAAINARLAEMLVAAAEQALRGG